MISESRPLIEVLASIARLIDEDIGSSRAEHALHCCQPSTFAS